MSGFPSLIKECALVCLLKRGPEDMPPSTYGLLSFAIILMTVIWGISQAIPMANNQLMVIEAFDLLVTFSFVAIALKIADKLNRYLQSMIAVIGTEALFNLALLVMLLAINIESSGGIIIVAFSTFCYFWRLVVLCHIFRSMLSSDLPAALLTTMTFEAVRIIMMLSFIPLLGNGG